MYSLTFYKTHIIVINTTTNNNNMNNVALI